MGYTRPGRNVVVRDYEAERDAEAVDALWSRVFGRPAGGQSPSWLFRPGPAGPAPRAVADMDGRVVAHAGGMPLRFRLDGDEVRGAYSVAAMTAPEARGRGLFFRLGEHLYTRMEREGFAFVAGFSNQRSHRLMTGPLGRTPVRPFPWCVRLLRPADLPAALLRGVGPPPAAPEAAVGEEGGIHVEPCEPGDVRLDALWERAAPALRLGARRDAVFSTWRFGTRREAGYRLALALRGGVPVAYGAYRGLALGRVRAGFVADLLVAPGEARAGRTLLRSLEELARSHGAHVMNALRPPTGPAREALRRSNYRWVPEALHPKLIRFSVRGLGRYAGDGRLTDPDVWTLSWADTDVV